MRCRVIVKAGIIDDVRANEGNAFGAGVINVIVACGMRKLANTNCT